MGRVALTVYGIQKLRRSYVIFWVIGQYVVLDYEPEEMTRLTKRILSAPPKLVERFFEVNGESIKVFTDTKIILRAEHK